MRKFKGMVAVLLAALAATFAMPGSSRAQQATPSNTATIEVTVPADAWVWFDDTLMKQGGTERLFESPPLTPGKAYSYVITAQWHGPDGQDVVRKQQVTVRANESNNVEFVPRTSYSYSTYYPTDYGSGYYGRGRGLFSGYYRVGNVIINGRRWGDIGYRYSHGDLIRW